MIAQYETDLIVRKMDENGDSVFGNGRSDFLSGIDAMRQVLQTRLNVSAGEWWEGDATAIPYMGGILGAYSTERNRELIDLMVVERILDTVGVVSVSDITSSYNGRGYHFKCTVTTVYGVTTAEVTA